MISLVISILAFVLALVCLVYSIHVAVVFNRFNDGIKDWAYSLDISTNAAIQRSALDLLRQMDEKITEQNENHDVEPINDENNE